MKNAGKACNNRLYRHIRTFEKIVKNYFVICNKNVKERVNMITTREFFEHDAEDIINNIESIYSVQRKKQINIFLSHFQVKMSF